MTDQLLPIGPSLVPALERRVLADCGLKRFPHPTNPTRGGLCYLGEDARSRGPAAATQLKPLPR